MANCNSWRRSWHVSPPKRFRERTKSLEDVKKSKLLVLSRWNEVKKLSLWSLDEADRAVLLLSGMFLHSYNLLLSLYTVHGKSLMETLQLMNGKCLDNDASFFEAKLLISCQGESNILFHVRSLWSDLGMGTHFTQVCTKRFEKYVCNYRS